MEKNRNGVKRCCCFFPSFFLPKLLVGVAVEGKVSERVCVCQREKERERERDWERGKGEKMENDK